MLRSKTKNPGIIVAIEALREMSLSKTLKAEWDFYLKQRRDRSARDEFVRDEFVRDEGKAIAVDRVMKKMNLDLKTACDIVGISINDYNSCKKRIEKS